jgi:hypothetical protein
MRPKDLSTLKITTADDFVTNVDPTDQGSNFLQRTLGFRRSSEMFIGQRDYGTKHRYASYPTGITIKNQFTFYDATSGIDYDIIVGLDASNNLRVFIWDVDRLDSQSRWNEVTLKYTTTINDGSIAATDTSVTIASPVSDILGNSVTLDANRLDRWIAFNVTRSNYCLVNNSGATTLTSILGQHLGGSTVALSDATNASPIKITSTTDLAAAGWVNGRVVKISGVVGNTAANGTWQINNIAGFTADLLGSVGNGAYSSGGTVQSGLGWQNGDSLVLFRMTALTDYTYGNGTEPHIRMLAHDGGAKSTLYYGSSSSLSEDPTMRKPVQLVRRSAAKQMFLSNSAAALLKFRDTGTYDLGWQLERGGGGFTPSCVTRNLPDSPYTGDTDDAFEVSDESGNVFMKGAVRFIDLGYSTGTFKSYSLRATLGYEGGQESDIVYEVHAQQAGSPTASLYLAVIGSLIVNPALLNKKVTTVHFYAAGRTEAEVAAKKVIADNDYSLVCSIPLDTGKIWSYGIEYSMGAEWGYWETIPTSDFCQVFTPGSSVVFGYTLLPQNTGTGVTMSSRFGRASDRNRSIITPKFGVKMARFQGGIVLVNEGNNGIRSSIYNGDGVHEDDNLPDLTADNSGNRIKIFLNGNEQMLGMGVDSDNVLAFYGSMLQSYDFQSGIQSSVPADVVAKQSIVQTPYGLMWAGVAGIYIFSFARGGLRVMNELWKNFYDGSLLNDAGTPYVTSAYRQAITAHYNTLYDEAWFTVQVNKDTADGGGTAHWTFRYSFRTEKWSVRQFGAAPVAFSSRKDATTSIASASALVYYPNTGGAYPWQDLVSSVDGAGSGITTSVRLIVGEIADTVKQNVIWGILPDWKGSSIDGKGQFRLRIYANRETTPFDTHYFSIDQIPDVRLVTPYNGPLESVRFEVDFPSGVSANFKEFELSSMTIYVIPRSRKGVF